MIRFALLSFLLYSGITWAQPGFDWQRTVGGSGNDALEDILISGENTIWCVGQSTSNISFDKTENSRGSNDFWVTRLDGAGNLIWQKTIGGTQADAAYSMVMNGNSYVVVGGSSSSNISGEKTENSRGFSDYWLVKLDLQGNLLWQKTLGGSGTDVFRSLVATADGGLILGGYSLSGISGEKTEPVRGSGLYSDYWIVKLDALGNIQWQRTLGGDGMDQLSNLLQTGDGGYVAAGLSASNASFDKTEDARGLTDFWVLKLDAAGNLLWQRTLGGAGAEHLPRAIETSNGKILLAGGSDSDISGEKSENSRGSSDYWVVQLSATGDLEWERTLGGTDFDLVYSLLETQSHHILVGGSSRSNTSGEKAENSRGLDDCWLLELDQDGNLLGQKTFGGNQAEGIYSIQETTNKELILGCYSRSGVSGEKMDFNRGESDYWVVKLASSSLQTKSFDAAACTAYPNPARHQVTVVATAGISQIKIYDLLGKAVLYQNHRNQKEAIVDVAALARGFYLLEVTYANNSRSVQKLLLN